MKGYRIKTVSRMTGISPELLRAWERRHGVVRPQRTEAGYREYDEEDVERLRLLGALTSRGYAIGELAGLDGGELRRRLGASGLEAESLRDEPRAGSVSVSEHLARLARRGDALELRRALRRALVATGARQLVRESLIPLLDGLGAELLNPRSRAALGGATAEVRGFLGPLACAVAADAPVAVVSAAPGEAVGHLRLVAALVAVERGWQPVTARTHAVGAERLAADLGAQLAVRIHEARPTAAELVADLEAWTVGEDTDTVRVVMGEGLVPLAGVASALGARTVAGPGPLGELMDELAGR